MNRPFSFLEHAAALFAALLLSGTPFAHAGTSLLPPGGSSSSSVAPLAEGGTIRTGADAGQLFSPLPGIAVTAGKGTIVSLVRADIAKSGDVVLSRNVALKLEEGTIAFSIDKRIASKTAFEVQTPLSRRSVQGLVGTITVEGSCVKLASLSGTIAFSAVGFGAPIAIKAGSFLSICGEGPNAQIRLVNAIAKTWTDYSADGALLATRAATGPELESTRDFFATALAHASSAEGAGLLGPSSAAEITQTLTRINESFAAAGLAAIEGSSVGALPPGARSANEGPDTGFGGGSMSPANTLGGGKGGAANSLNTSGAVNSPER